jgi:hypothetical protein
VIHLFCGYDQREAIGFHVFAQSVIDRASKPVAFVPLASMGLPQGSNTFTVSRFLIPYLMGFKGRAIFADASDMLMLGDVATLDGQFDPNYAAQVVQHPKYQTKHKVKYRGTAMECPNTDYDRKNWASLMLINCEHPVWADMTPERITSMKAVDLLQFKGIEPIGELPDCWNRLVDEGHYVAGANLLHWTAGVPGIPHYHDAPGAENWHAARAAMEQIL